jgi:hypothetical protein
MRSRHGDEAQNPGVVATGDHSMARERAELEQFAKRVRMLTDTRRW